MVREQSGKSCNSCLTEDQRRAFAWWDSLTINEKMWIGRSYEYVNSQQLILQAFNDYQRSFELKIVE